MSLISDIFTLNFSEHGTFKAKWNRRANNGDIILEVKYIHQKAYVSFNVTFTPVTGGYACDDFIKNFKIKDHFLDHKREYPVRYLDDTLVFEVSDREELISELARFLNVANTIDPVTTLEYLIGPKRRGILATLFD